MCLALGDGPPGFPQDDSCPVVLGIPLGPFWISITGLSPSMAGLPRPFIYPQRSHIAVPQPRTVLRRHGLGSSDFARHYFRNRCYFLFLQVLRCFSSLGSPPHPMDSDADHPPFSGWGFPIRTSPDQSLLGGSPRLIAACHVLHRQLLPRHPPYALSSLTKIWARSRAHKLFGSLKR